MNEVREFRLPPEAFNTILRRAILRSLAIMIGSFVVVLAISYVMNSGTDDLWEKNTIPFITSFVVLPITFWIALKREQRAMATYVLRFDGDSVRRMQENLPEIRIPLSEVRSIQRMDHGSLLIIGTDTRDRIIVPDLIENPAELEQILAQLATITAYVPGTRRFIWILVPLTVLCMFGLTLVKSKPIAAICGTMSASMILWAFVAVQRSRQVNKRTKRSSYWLLLIILSILSMIFTKLTD